MAWAVLLLSAVLEATWATALGASDGLRQPVPAVVFVLAAILSMIGLAHAMRMIPVGTAYAVWTGLGAALTVGWAIVAGDESASPARMVFIAMIVGAVVGLRFAPADVTTADPPRGRTSGRP